DAGDVLRLCVELGINFVFSGHKHQPWIWKLENTYFITAGTTTTRRLKGGSYPSFNVLNITEERALLKEINVPEESSKEILAI
ncbi:MAG: metallophosphoesterase, partial [Ignavibacteriales bacterium]